MRCAVIVHWEIQVAIFDFFFIHMNIAIRKYLLHRKTGIKQIVPTALYRSKKGFLKKKKKKIIILHSSILRNPCIREQCGKFPYSSWISYMILDLGLVVFRKTQNLMTLHQCPIMLNNEMQQEYLRYYCF